MVCTAEAAKCVVHLGRSYPREDPSCSGLVPTAKTTLNPAHVRPERRALHNEPQLDDTIRPISAAVVFPQGEYTRRPSLRSAFDEGATTLVQRPEDLRAGD